MTRVKRTTALLMLFLFTGCASLVSDFIQPSRCPMTVWNRPVDALPDPPFPERNHTGDEFTLVGIVRDAETCLPLADATVMFDMTNHAGDYDGTQTGTTETNALGFFTIRSNRPGAYGGGHPHIHLFIGKAGYTTITAGHDLLTAASTGRIELTLQPD